MLFMVYSREVVSTNPVRTCTRVDCASASDESSTAAACFSSIHLTVKPCVRPLGTTELHLADLPSNLRYSSEHEVMSTPLSDEYQEVFGSVASRIIPDDG